MWRIVVPSSRERPTMNVESCTFIGPSPRSPCGICRDGPPFDVSASVNLREIFLTRYTCFTYFTRMFPLDRVLVYSYTRMLIYSLSGITRLLVIRMFPLGEYSFYSHTRMLVLSPLGNSRSARSARLLVCSFARLLVCSFARLLVCSFARLLVYSLTGLLVNCTSPLEVHSFCSFLC
jgi:hypothetical protein